MSIKKYRVISESFWDGVQLRKQGEIVEIDTDVVKVNWDSKALEPIGDSPVFETRTAESAKAPEIVVSTKKSPRHHDPKLAKELTKDEQLAKAEAAKKADDARRAEERRAEEARREAAARAAQNSQP